MKLHTFFTAGSVALALALALPSIGCAASSEEASSGDEQDLSTKHTGDEGGMCGGIAGLRCKAGLECNLSGNHPDASGTCQKPKTAAEGEACGDDVAIRKKCASGLTCVLPAGAPISEHTAGTCRKVVSLTGEWGADGAILTFDHDSARIEFGCGTASIDTITPTGANTFVGEGSFTRGTGVQLPPGHGLQPIPATFKLSVSSHKLTLEETFDGGTSELSFTKDRQINLIRCL